MHFPVWIPICQGVSQNDVPVPTAAALPDSIIDMLEASLFWY